MSCRPAKPQQHEVDDSGWHAGERAMHDRVGVDMTGYQYFSESVPDMHRMFYQKLPYLAVGAVDPAGNVWASVLEGRAGFVDAPNPYTLDIRATPTPGDPILPALGLGRLVGVLGIELHTRRRIRASGVVAPVNGPGLSLSVRQAFGNCPQYIHQRNYTFIRDPTLRVEAGSGTAAAEQMVTLDAAARALIEQADTFFVASCSQPHVVGSPPSGGVDVSHRGGKPGFVLVQQTGNTTTLHVPDFAGNKYFNTLGNFVTNPRAGLLFIDFTTGDVLQVTGTVEIVMGGPQVNAFVGAERMWVVRVTAAVRRRAALALRWELSAGGMSRNVTRTGAWPRGADQASAPVAAPAPVPQVAGAAAGWGRWW